ncbi:hypothetical protein SH611_09310 [Geminicoccaceae bacterium 1502E]|nr:hypothetical protein [Geminicoccaceae bacterium 1502E]
MSEDRIFALVAGLCLLFWLLAREPRLTGRLRRPLLLAAWLILAAAMLVALVRSAAWFLG